MGQLCEPLRQKAYDNYWAGVVHNIQCGIRVLDDDPGGDVLACFGGYWEREYRRYADNDS